MAKIIDVRYSKLWVRLLCCLAVAVGVWRAFDLVALRMIEQLVYSFLLADFAFSYKTVPDWMKTAIVFALSLGPALFKTERPILLIFVNLSVGLLYFLVVIVALFNFYMILPVSAPFLGLILSTTVLDTMAWSQERTHRRVLERMEEAKQNFTDMLVHDLTNRMASISMSFSLLEKSIPRDDKKNDQLIKTIRTSSDRMMTQINALLDIRKIQEGRMILNRERMRLTDFLLNVIDEFQPASEFIGVRLKLVSPEDVRLRIDVDRDIFSRVLANLFWNAIHHAPKDSDVELGYVDAPEGIILFMSNDGDPIPAEDQELIFDKFVSGAQDIKGRKGAGAGIGLAFCKLAVEAHGGSIRIESPLADREGGVKVYITLPKV